MAGDLVTDSPLLHVWAETGDLIYRWTGDEGEKYFVPSNIFRMLNEPWRG